MKSVLSPRERVRERVYLGSSEVKRSGRQADISGQSPRKTLFTLFGEGLSERVFSWHSAQTEGTQDCANVAAMQLRIKSAMTNYYGQGSLPLLGKVRMGFKQFQPHSNPLLVKERGNNSTKQTSRPNVLTSSRLKKKIAKVSLEPQYYLNFSCSKLKEQRTTFIENCRKNTRETSGVSSSVYCTYMIYCNGWKIPDDYPIRL